MNQFIIIEIELRDFFVHQEEVNVQYWHFTYERAKQICNQLKNAQ